MDERKLLTASDLAGVWIRVQDETGKWGNGNCLTCTPQQFEKVD